MKTNARILDADRKQIAELGESINITNSKDLVNISKLILKIDLLFQPLDKAASVKRRGLNEMADFEGKIKPIDKIQFDKDIDEIYDTVFDLGKELRIPIKRAEKWSLKPNVLAAAFKYYIVEMPEDDDEGEDNES